MARDLSSQLSTITQTKIIQSWKMLLHMDLCGDVPKKLQNTLTEYFFEEGYYRGSR